jgi:hypothetical protein
MKMTHKQIYETYSLFGTHKFYPENRFLMETCLSSRKSILINLVLYQETHFRIREPVSLLENAFVFMENDLVSEQTYLSSWKSVAADSSPKQKTHLTSRKPV